MKMSDVKQVKVDNWGIYFLQRLKHFFNRTDYCDLTLQFQDNAQLKVHRLVLSACTEYFELLERTCEMYEDCLVMPDDLQADVVVPIINFMYTGQLEFKMELLDRLYQTSEIMNMPVLSKLLNSHRPHKHKTKAPQSYPIKRVSKPVETAKVDAEKEVLKPSSSGIKRSYGKAFETQYIIKDKKLNETPNKRSLIATKQGVLYKPPSPIPFDNSFNKKYVLGDPRPTRYELPEELDTENVFENSFSNISYTSQPLMVHPETRKQYSKRPRQIGESSSKSFGASTVDIVECKKITKAHQDSIFEDTLSESITGETEMFQPYVKIEPMKDSSHLFDQIVEQTSETAKVTIETTKSKNSPNTPNLDHAKIISEVLKKYPHLVKSNKNIKLKILNPPNKTSKRKVSQMSQIEKQVIKTEPEPDFTYETDVLDSKQAAKLIALGAENIEGPWICLICGTPGRALQFTSYYKYRRHLVEVHNEKPVLTICEYCGQRTNKINYMLYHMYTKHDIEPPPQYQFPKCNKCDYIALTEALLIKHKKNHSQPKDFRNYVALTQALAAKPQHKQPERNKFICDVCSASFKTMNQLLTHIQITGHKYKKPHLQCIYCMKTFLRESNFYAHLKIHHKSESIADGILDDSDEEIQTSTPKMDNVGLSRSIKSETPVNDFEEVDVQYQIKQGPDGIHVVAKKQSESPNTKQKILNAGFSTQVEVQKAGSSTLQNEFMQELNITSGNDNNDVIMIDNTEYLLKGNKLVHRKPKQIVPESILPDAKCEVPIDYDPNIQENVQVTEIMKTSNLVSQSGHPISIYVSNEEEYKALMTANHPIIFDPDDTNKSLTVLTAPNSDALETTAIDLDTTQSNDMMIIQDGYPINVSDAVATENSNIVVVYSHDVDQNKEYQLISTQGLEQQFVQSSAIITQNYETVTTSTPVMSAHVLGAQIDGNWQTATTIPQNINNQTEPNPTETELHQTISCEDVEMAGTIEQNTTINDLPQVEMVPNKIEQSNKNITNEVLLPHAGSLPQIITDVNITTQEIPSAKNIPEIISTENLHNEVTTTDNVSQINDETITEAMPHTENIIESAEPHVGVNIQDESLITTVSEEPDVSTEEIVEEIPNAENDTDTLAYATNHENNTIINEVTLHSNSHEIGEQIIMPLNDETNEESENVEGMVQDKTELVENEQVLMSASITDEDDNDEAKEEGNDEVNNDVSNSEEGIEKNQALASEWSEDSETVSQDTNILPANKETMLNNESEMEESIENIQQEVVRHLTKAQSAPVINNETESDTLDENDSITNEENKIPETQDNTEENGKVVDLNLVGNPVAPTEKISSLLNDWEDNYSQDDDSSINDNASADDSGVIESPQIEPAKQEKPVEPQDKIKSLVSDWDDDDEDK